ncbi:MAG: YqgE/AlgH family protein [Bacteroidales bacterium]|jgi:putative transcriptional regulator|nr:YqgE/AlgH family protein [Bacteroidales bacterium]
MLLDDDLYKVETNHVAPRRGRVLIAEPFLRGCYFRRAVILLATCDADGSVGFILNHSEIHSLNRMLGFPEGWYVSVGGPVCADTLYFIHTLDDLAGSSLIADGIFWGGDVNILRMRMLKGTVTPAQVRFFLGYSGWASGQLATEVSENSWLVSRIAPQQVMAAPKPSLWKSCVRQVGGKYALWANFPFDPTLN